MTFGEKIRELRLLHQLTQRDLANKLQREGLEASFTYVSKIENGKLDFPPSEELILGIAKVLETDAEELMVLAGKFNPRALQEVVSKMPEAGILLRKLQAKQVTSQQMKQINKFLEEGTNEGD